MILNLVSQPIYASVFFGFFVSFRQACMNFPEAVGIVGCPLNCGRRVTDENQENNRFWQSL